MFTFMTISNKSVTWQSSATLIVAVIVCIKSSFSLLAFKLNIFSPQSVVLLVITFTL